MSVCPVKVPHMIDSVDPALGVSILTQKDHQKHNLYLTFANMCQYTRLWDTIYKL